MTTAQVVVVEEARRAAKSKFSYYHQVMARSGSAVSSEKVSARPVTKKPVQGPVSKKK